MKRDNALVQEMKLYFGTDEKRIAHALDVMRYAQLLLTTEAGCAGVVIPAAILHDIGIHEAEKKSGSSAGPYQEKEGPPIARTIMEKLGIDTKIIDEVCTIIAYHHSPGKIDTLNFKILYDADWLVNLADEYDCRPQEKLIRIIDQVFLTGSGKTLARKSYLFRRSDATD